MIDTRTAPYAALLLRLTLGDMFVAHALLKVFVFTVPGTVQFFGRSASRRARLCHIAAEARRRRAAPARCRHALGGCVALIPVLLGATWVHRRQWLALPAPKGGWEYPVFLRLPRQCRPC